MRWRKKTYSCFFFLFNDTATTEIYTLSLHDALPIFGDIFRLTKNGSVDLATDTRKVGNRNFALLGDPSLRLAYPENSIVITDILDDLYKPRSRAEQIASATVLFDQLANHFLRSRQLWSAKGKTIPRRLRAVDFEFAVRFEESFQELFATGHTAQVIALAEEVLERSGGRLLGGHKLAAPLDWRQVL